MGVFGNTMVNQVGGTNEAEKTLIIAGSLVLVVLLVITIVKILGFKTSASREQQTTVLVQIFLADLILVYWVPRNEGLRA
jgi:hypothetical protein